MTLPGNLSHGLPPRPDPLQDVMKRVRDLERQLRETRGQMSSVLNSVTGAVGNSTALNRVALSFAVPHNPSISTIINLSVPVPSGYGHAAIIVQGAVSAINSGASTDEIYAAVNLNGAGDTVGLIGAATPAGQLGSVNSSYAYSGAVSGTVSIKLDVQAGGGTWASSSSNNAVLSALILWSA